MPKDFLYVLSTHWDREWYQTFQDFRGNQLGKEYLIENGSFSLELPPKKIMTLAMILINTAIHV